MPAGFPLVIGYAEDNLFPVVFLDHGGLQARRYRFPVHDDVVTVGKDTVFFDFTQHVFLCEHAQMPLHILGRDRLRRVENHVGEEILPLLRKPDGFKFIRGIVLRVMPRHGIDRVKDDIVRRERGDPAQ